MAEELQQLLEKIQRDGVNKAQTEADALLAAARAEAETIVKKARSEAHALQESAQADAAAFEKRAEETIAHVARDTILQVEQAVTALFERLLLQNIDAALASQREAVARLALAAIERYTADAPSAEATLAGQAELTAILRAQLADKAGSDSGLQIVTDQGSGSGFTVKLDNGRVEHAFTSRAVAQELAQRLRPGLAKLMRTEG